MKTMEELFEAVEGAIEEAKLIAFDNCHKIYLAMDDEQARWFAENYPVVFKGPAEAMLETAKNWYENSCSLRFVSAVRTDHEDPNAGFAHLIDQFAEYDDEEEEEEES